MIKQCLPKSASSCVHFKQTTFDWHTTMTTCKTSTTKVCIWGENAFFGAVHVCHQRNIEVELIKHTVHSPGLYCD